MAGDSFFHPLGSVCSEIHPSKARLQDTTHFIILESQAVDHSVQRLDPGVRAQVGKRWIRGRGVEALSLEEFATYWFTGSF